MTSCYLSLFVIDIIHINMVLKSIMKE